jgi:hypothetical protein
MLLPLVLLDSSCRPWPAAQAVNLFTAAIRAPATAPTGVRTANITAVAVIKLSWATARAGKAPGATFRAADEGTKADDGQAKRLKPNFGQKKFKGLRHLMLLSLRMSNTFLCLHLNKKERKVNKKAEMNCVHPKQETSAKGLPKMKGIR